MADTFDALFGSDPIKERDGIVVQYGPIRVRLARLGGANDKFKKLFEKKMRPWRAMVEAELMPEDEARKILYESFAEAIVLEWSGFLIDGEDIPFSVEECVKRFTSHPQFFVFCQTEASKFSNYKVTAETDIKN